MANPDHIKACLEQTKTLLSAVIEREPDFRLKNCLGNIEKIEALMRGDYETVWRIETEQRKRDAEFHERFVKNLRTIQRGQQALREANRCSAASSEPLLAALLAMRATQPISVAEPGATSVPLPSSTGSESDDEDLYS